MSGGGDDAVGPGCGCLLWLVLIALAGHFLLKAW